MRTAKLAILYLFSGIPTYAGILIALVIAAKGKMPYVMIFLSPLIILAIQFFWTRLLSGPLKLESKIERKLGL